MLCNRKRIIIHNNSIENVYCHRYNVDSGRKECPLRYGGAGFRFGRRETPEIFGCDYLAVEMDDGDISFPFISMR